MTFDLFEGESGLQPISIEDADISFARSISLPASPNDLLQELIDATPWRAEAITVWGRKFLQPRLIAWYGDAGTGYSYSGLGLDPLPWTARLQLLREIVQSKVEVRFNSVLLNYYRDNRDSMGMHSDDEPELGFQPVIASLSLGETRTFVLKHKTRPNLKPIRLDLPSGSLLLMKGDTQKFWKHGIEKQAKPCGPRINLTFRCVRLTV